MCALLSYACGEGDSTTRSDAATADSSLAPANDAGSDAALPSEAATSADGDAALGLADARTAEEDANGSVSPDAATATGIGGLRAQLCTATSYASPLSASGATPSATQLGTTTFGFVEGAVWVAEKSALFFSDMDFGAASEVGPLSRIWRMDIAGNASTFVASSGSNGLALGPPGTLLAATHDTRSLSLYNLDTGARTELNVLRDGKHFDSPNDLVMRSDGTVYFSDPDWQLGGRDAEITVTAAYRVAAPLSAGVALAAQSFDDTLDKPNGIALSPDEHTLYLGSSGTEIWAFDVANDGTPSNRRMFANPGASDGMTVDCAGNLYVTAGATVHVFAADGSALGEIVVPETPSNLAFGGTDRQTLFITAQSHVYSIHLAVPGFPY